MVFCRDSPIDLKACPEIVSISQWDNVSSSNLGMLTRKSTNNEAEEYTCKHDYPIPSTTYSCTQIQNQAELVELTILNAPICSLSAATDEWAASKDPTDSTMSKALEKTMKMTFWPVWVGNTRLKFIGSLVLQQKEPSHRPNSCLGHIQIALL